MALSDAYERTYSQLLAELGGAHDRLPSLVCLHWPMHQPTYSGKLLVVGQAPNYWFVTTPPGKLVNEAARDRLLAETREVSEKTDAFDWMQPQARGRPFWRLVDVAMAELGLTLAQIGWSNLAKVAPDGGNPTGEFLCMQHDLGGQLLRQEVQELDPELVLIISGRGYTEPFLTSAGLTPRWSREGALKFDGLLDGRRWLIVNHPGTFAYRYDASWIALSRSLRGGP